jgi:hypothetical protein
MDTIAELQSYMRGLVAGQKGLYEGNIAAAWYAERYREELDISSNDLNYDQESALVLSQLYLSSVSANSRLRLFMFTSRWTGRGSPDAQRAKQDFLKARKFMQNDLDAYLDHFETESAESKYEVLTDTMNMARLVTMPERFVDADFYTNTHIFIGSVLSERMVKVAIEEMEEEEARYADEYEEVSPFGADVISNDIHGNPMHLQVKMRWRTPDKLRIKQQQTPPWIVVPMESLRDRLDIKEASKLRRFIRRERRRRAALALQTGEDRELQAA